MIFTVGPLPTVGWDGTIEEIASLAALAERMGISRFGVSDMVNGLDCVIVMAAILENTDVITVESLVMNPYYRNPTLIGNTFRSLRERYPDRVICGLGAGVDSYPRAWLPGLGLERPHPIQLVERCAETCRSLWDANDARGLSNDIPLLIAASGPRMLELAGRLATIVHIGTLLLDAVTLQERLVFIERGIQLRTEARSSNPEVDLSVALCVGDDSDAVRESASTVAARAMRWLMLSDPDAAQRIGITAELARQLKQWDMWEGRQLPEAIRSMIGQDLLDQFVVAGDPAECSRRLQRIIAEYEWATGIRLKVIGLGDSVAYDGMRTALLLLGETLKVVKDEGAWLER